MAVGSRCKARAHVEPVCGPAEGVVEVRDGKQRMQLLYTYTILYVITHALTACVRGTSVSFMKGIRV